MRHRNDLRPPNAGGFERSDQRRAVDDQPVAENAQVPVILLEFESGAMIAAGWLLIERFHWIIYVFGAFLVFTGLRMATHGELEIEPEENPILKLICSCMPVTSSYEGNRFFTRSLVRGRMRLAATPLFVVLVVVETTDVVFAMDSIPAIFAVTRDPFLVFSSNAFAILGLRSMYFLLAGIIDKFHYLKLNCIIQEKKNLKNIFKI